MDTEKFDLDFELTFENPLLYAAGFSALSVLVNVYCCYRNCCGGGRGGRGGRDAVEESVELTKFDSRPVVAESRADVDLEAGNGVESQDGEDKNRKLVFKPATSDDSTQTEDCAFYEMMGSRFSNELDYYQRMNMKGLGTTRIDTGAGVGM